MRLRTALIAAALLTTGMATGSSAADAYGVTAVHVTPVLADFPYDPVLDGTVYPSGGDEVEDTDDCTISRFEDRGDFRGLGVYSATGCGGARITFDVRSTRKQTSYAGVSGRTTATYGCVNVHNHHTRELFTTGRTLVGDDGVDDIPIVAPGVSSLGFHTLNRLETVTCRRPEQPAQLSLTVDQVVVSVYPDSSYSAANAEVHRVPGAWSARLSLPAPCGPHKGPAPD